MKEKRMDILNFCKIIIKTSDFIQKGKILLKLIAIIQIRYRGYSPCKPSFGL